MTLRPNEETFDLVAPGHTYTSVTEKISSIVLDRRVSLRWLAAVMVGLALAGVLTVGIGTVLLFGVGLWGNNQTVSWAFDIVNFVTWIGIGHAGTLISAILLLLHQAWRTSINRYAEAMTLFAVLMAGLFPLIHIGRHMFAYWLFPLPNSMGLWPQFRSPLVWDVFAVTTYLTVSALFWYVGLIPDLATLRDRARTSVAKLTYGVLAMGWRGSARHWQRYSALYLLLAGISTPLVVSVHTIVSFDFAVGIVPGWHVTLFPPYFVAGAIFAGFAMALLLAIPMRHFFGLRDLITMRHLENMGKLMLATGLIVFYAYLIEIFFAWYSANPYERYLIFSNRMRGPYGWTYWLLLLLNGLLPQLLWFRRFRTSPPVLFAIALGVTVGMWFERFVIIVTSLSRDYLPSMWAFYGPTGNDWAFLLGTVGTFVLLFLLFARLLPVISIAEMRELIMHQGHVASYTLHGSATPPER